MFYYTDAYTFNNNVLYLYIFLMTLWKRELLALLMRCLTTLNIPSTNQISGKLKWHKRACEIIQIGNCQKLFSGKYV